MMIMKADGTVFSGRRGGRVNVLARRSIMQKAISEAI